MDLIKVKENNEKIYKGSRLNKEIKFNWKEFNLDKFFEDTNKAGEIIEKKEKEDYDRG